MKEIKVNTKKSPQNSLLLLYPNIAAELHPTLNGRIDKEKISAFSPIKLYWQCDKNPEHFWDASVVKRTRRKQGCPSCAHRRPSKEYNLLVINPKLCEEWDFELNSKGPENYLPNGSQIVNWVCKKNSKHIWPAQIASRNRGSGCRFCNGSGVSIENSFATKHPKLAEQWIDDLNYPASPSNVRAGSHKKYFFRCNKNPEHPPFDKPLYEFVKSKGSCPYCAGKRVCLANCLATKRPDIAKNWHPTKNGETTPYDITPGEGEMRWWICPLGHSYQATPNKRTYYNQGCPKCSKHQVSELNRLSILRPDVAAMLHPTKNKGVTGDHLSVCSDKEIWFLCENGHEPFVSVSTMVKRKRNGCKYCYGREATAENNLAVLHPEILQFWDRKRNKKEPSRYTQYSNKEVYWICPKGHSYKMRISNKVLLKYGCPQCYPKVSANEHRMFSELKSIFKDVEKRRWGRWELDAFIPSLNIGVEYDGRYYHKNFRRDIRKNRFFLDRGISIIRIRENQLLKISDCDIILESIELKKMHLNKLLNVIVTLKTRISSKINKRIAAYLKKDSFQNQALYEQLTKDYHLPPPGRSLAERYPKLALEWCQKLNGNITPWMIYAHEKRKRWWNCPNGHDPYFASVDHRSRGTGCKKCHLERIGQKKKN